MAARIGAMMFDVLANTASMSTSVSKIEKDINGMAAGATKALGMLGIAFGVKEVLGFAKDVIDAAGKIDDLSISLGIGTTAVQRYSNAADIGGSSIDAVGKAINKMNVNLAGGKDSTKEALAAAGLSFDAIRKMRPEEAFDAIAAATASIVDPMERARVRTELLGKGAVELAGTLDNLKNTTNDGLIPPETIKALADLGDGFDVAKQKGMQFGAWIVGGLVRDIQTGQSWIESTYLKLTLGSKGAEEAARLQQQMSAISAKATEDAERKKQVALAASADAQEKSLAAAKRKAEEDKKAAAAAEAHAKAIRDLADSYSGKNDIEEAKNVLAALAQAHIGVKDVAKLSADAQQSINKSLEEGIDVFKRYGQIAPQAMRDLYIATLPLPKVISGIPAAMAGMIGEVLEIKLPEIPKAVAKNLDDVENAVAASGPGIEAATEGVAGGMVNRFSGACERIESRVGLMGTQVERTLAAMQQTEAYKKAGLFVERGFGTADEINRMALRSTSVPGFAEGVRNFRGGMALVGERGPELVNLPGGSDVIPNGRFGAPVTIIVNVKNNANPQEIADAMSEKAKRIGLI